MTKANIFEF